VASGQEELLFTTVWVVTWVEAVPLSIVRVTGRAVAAPKCSDGTECAEDWLDSSADQCANEPLTGAPCHGGACLSGATCADGVSICSASSATITADAAASGAPTPRDARA